MFTIEEIYAAVIREGVSRGFSVVPEFSVAAADKTFKKRIDVAWLLPRNDEAKNGSLRRWKIAAAFEIEGYDVPLDRIELHSAQFNRLQNDWGESFPCFVPLYTIATHRSNAHWGSETPDRYIADRKQAAERSGSVVKIIDARVQNWLSEIGCRASG